MATKGLCPFAVHKLIGAGSNDPPIRPRLAILHVDAGNASSLFDFFRDRSGGIESHFFVRKDGVLEQYRSIYLQADANLDANDFAVSIETQGFGAGEWNTPQLDTIKRLLLWLHAEARIPVRKADKWNGSGIGYHVMFGAPGHWTPVSKSCPGPDRVRQFHNVLVPWFNNPKGKPMPNRVELAHQMVKSGLHDLRKALELLRDVDHEREQVAEMENAITSGVRAIAAAAGEGPQK